MDDRTEGQQVGVTPPLFHSNAATIQLSTDEVILDFKQVYPDVIEVTQTMHPRTKDILASPVVVRVVATFQVATELHDYLTRALPFIRQARAAPPATVPVLPVTSGLQGVPPENKP